MKKQLLLHSKKTLFREFSFRMAALAVLTFLTAQSSFAQTTATWVGTTADFLTGTNWNPTIATFNNGDIFTINAVVSPQFNPVLNSAATCATISTKVGSILTTNADFTTGAGTNSIEGTVYINAGTWNTPKLYIGNGTGGAGVVNVATGGTLSGTGVWRLGSSTVSGTHYLNINNGGVVKTASTSDFGIGFTSTRKGVLTVNTGGLAQINGVFTISTTAGNGTVNVAGGSLEFNPVNLNVNAGVINITAGSLKLLSATPTINATSASVGTSTSGLINIAGGSLIASGPLTIGSATVGLVTVNVNSGTMNVAGALTISAPSSTYTGLVNVDAGSIILDGDQTTAIATLITAGRIAVSGAALTAGKVLSNTYDVGTGKTTVVAVTPSSTNWDGAAWSNGAPSASVAAIIDGTYLTDSNGAFTAAYLYVNAGKSFTLKSGTNVTVQNAVINNGSLVVENNANLIQVNINNANTGAITVNRNSNALSRLDYTLWSSPVASQNLAAFSPLTSQSPSRFYTYTPGTPDVYTVVASPTTTTFAAGTGYLIRMPNTAVAYPATETFAGVFTGVPNNGNVSRTGLTAGKFYAVGNPYPSTISAASFLSGNATAGTTLYFWRKTNGVANSGSSYATWTTVGGTAAGNVAPNNIVPNGSIQVGQGFVVNTGTATSLTFTNAMREAAPSSTQFLKVAKSDEKSRIWLNLTAPGLFSQALIGYVDGATEGVDNGFDGEYINDSPIALTSNIDGGEYTIQGRPAFDTSDVVALNFKTDKAGEYKIAIDHTDGVFAKGQAVYLADSVTGKETDLTKEAYTFTAESGTANNRFTLKYQSSSKTVGSPVFNENTVTVYKNNGILYVNSAASAIVTIKVFNLQGRLIGEQKDVNATTAAIKNLKATQQVLFVQVTSEDGKVVTKKVVN